MKKIISFILMGLLIFTMYGCGKESENIIDTEDGQTIESYIASYFDSIKDGSNEELSSLIKSKLSSALESANISIDTESATEKVMGVFSNMNYTINSISVDGDTAVANVTVTSVDLKAARNEVITKVGKEYVSSLMGGDTSSSYTDILKEIFNNLTLEERSGEINLVKENNEWKVQTDDSLTKLLTNMKLSDDE